LKNKIKNDIAETQLEFVLLNSYKTEMVTYLTSHPEDFEEAINLAVTDKQPLSWRAAWLLWGSMVYNDNKVVKHVNEIVKALPSRKHSQLRDLLMVLQKIDLPEDVEGEVFDISMKTWEDVGKIASVRFAGLKMLIKIVNKHPELKHELEFLTENHYIDSLSKAAKKSLHKMMKELR